MKKKAVFKKFRFLLFVPALLFMCMIFSFSGETGEESSSLSLTVTTTVVDSINNVVYDKTMSNDSYQNLIDTLHTPVRKLAHMSEYAILYLLIFFPLMTYNIRFSIYHLICPVVICFLYACTDEFHQTFIDERCGQFSDVLIDMSGTLISVIITFLVLNAKKMLTYKKNKI